MKNFTLQSLVLVALVLAPVLSFAQQIPTLDFFHGRECPHCQNEKKWFPTLRTAYPDIIINEYEVWHDTDNQALWAERLAEMGETPSGVPSNVIGDRHVVGFSPERILAAMEEQYGPPAVDVSTIAVEETAEPAGLDYILIAIVLGGVALAGGIAFLGKKE